MKEYISYICKSCGRTFILISYEINRSGYIKCPHCSSRKIKESIATDDLRECIKHSAYKKIHGALRQVR